MKSSKKKKIKPNIYDQIQYRQNCQIVLKVSKSILSISILKRTIRIYVLMYMCLYISIYTVPNFWLSTPYNLMQE